MTTPLDLFLFTYNCNKQTFDAGRFTEKLAQSFPDDPAQLFVFGVQEFCSVADGCFPDVARKIMLSLNELYLAALESKYSDVRFKTIALSHVGAIGLVVITTQFLQFDSRVRYGEVGAGYAYSSMKGGIGVRVLLPDTEITFVNAHLPAYEGLANYNKRNQAVTDIFRAMDFGDGYGVLKPGAHVFFMGDLNYRTTQKYDAKSDSQQRLLLLSDSEGFRNIEELLVYDELLQGRAAGDVFLGFSEAKITFNPTYKYHLNTAIYNAHRSPSWCDRILYQSTYENRGTKEGISILGKAKKTLPHVNEYSSIDSLLQSDHQPVFLSITIPRQAPRSMVSRSGYLQLLPSQPQQPESTRDVRSVLDTLDDYEESVAGPTQIYVNPTKVDFLIQRGIRPISDFVIGYGLFVGTTKNGRLVVLLLVLVLWTLYICIR